MRTCLLVASLIVAACGTTDRSGYASAMERTTPSLLIVKFKDQTRNDAMVQSLSAFGRREARVGQPAARRLAEDLSARTGTPMTFYDVASGGALLLTVPSNTDTRDVIERLAKTAGDIEFAEPAGYATPQAR